MDNGYSSSQARKDISYFKNNAKSRSESIDCREVDKSIRIFSKNDLSVPLKQDDPGVKQQSPIRSVSPFHLHMMKSQVWTPFGQAPKPVVVGSKLPNSTKIIAINTHNIVYPEGIYSWCENYLGKSLITILMDNVPIHHASQEFYDSYPYQIKYIPAYSPFPNLCEEVFQRPLRGNIDLTQ
ncbi:hypothetical protein RF11_12168 [Thelohanellus kitauei]|uniref:Tc1-like transposase DDE domain-containing protein n=1 Tax=Thelohanellus kitauei TaxID=669202 RepID=A0A0C2ICA6_THEKT|nr:hypothetical protein RF11_12168 [Thelohanellus kitauei]